MTWGDADRNVFIEAAVFGVTVVSGATTVTGIEDYATEEMLPGIAVSQLGTNHFVSYATGAISPVAGGSITVAGVTYTVTEVRYDPRYPDGRFSIAFLATA